MDEQTVIQQTAEQRNEQRVKDLEIMKHLDGNMNTFQKKTLPSTLLDEMNERLWQYIRQMPFSFDYLALQTVQDFNKWVTALQIRGALSININTNVPIAIVKDTGAALFVVRKTRHDYLDYNSFIFKTAENEFDHLSIEEQEATSLYDVELSVRAKYPPPVLFVTEKPKE